MKKNNPHTPIMIREAMGIEPRVYARYEFGREKVADLKGEHISYTKEKTIRMCVLTPRDPGLDDKAIEDKISNLVRGEA